jgi:hypothetical protein
LLSSDFDPRAKAGELSDEKSRSLVALFNSKVSVKLGAMAGDKRGAKNS